MEVGRPLDTCLLHLGKLGREDPLGGHVQGIGQGRQGCRQALRQRRDLVLARETSVAAARVAVLLASPFASPGRHPGLHVRGPALDAALLLQQEALAVNLLEAPAEHDEDPHGDRRDDGAPEELPREHGRLELAGLVLGSGLALLALGRLHLLREAGLAGLEVLGCRHEVDGLLESGRQGPLHGAPGITGVLGGLLVAELRGGEVVEADGPGELDGVADPRDGVDEALQERSGVQDAVVDGHAENGKHGHEGHNLLDGEAHQRTLAGLAGDVEAEDAPVGGHEASGDRPRGPQKAELPEDVAHRVEAGGGEPV
mmetsp:Transcript_60361/g.171038  ORF Transcript_60361/g.171038 Transcript_60361/m.171038 type:complete len:313 (+) Transcript_60361:1069-2007(+)